MSRHTVASQLGVFQMLKDPYTTSERPSNTDARSTLHMSHDNGYLYPSEPLNGSLQESRLFHLMSGVANKFRALWRSGPFCLNRTTRLSHIPVGQDSSQGPSLLTNNSIFRSPTTSMMLFSVCAKNMMFVYYDRCYPYQPARSGRAWLSNWLYARGL